MDRHAPNERRWTAFAAAVLALAFTAAGLVAAILPATVSGNHLHEAAECGTAFFHTGPEWCDGVNTPFEIVALALFGLAAVSAAVLAISLRRRERQR